VNRSRVALQLTLQRFLEPTVFEPSPWVYLHTLTFENPEPDETEAFRRWNSFATGVLRPLKFACVRVAERGGLHGRLHFHLISRARPVVTYWRHKLPQYGFGRTYNVERIPADRAYYVIKYVGKGRNRLFGRGVRLWACVGFEGVRVSDVVITYRARWALEPVPLPLYDDCIIRVGGNDTVLPIRSSPVSERIARIMELKPHQLEELAVLLGKGLVGTWGEYRGCQARSWDGTSKTSPTGKVKYVVADHALELGGKQLKVTEWLPAGSDEKDVKPAADRGEIVFVRVDRMENVKGTQVATGGILRFAALPLKGGGRA